MDEGILLKLSFVVTIGGLLLLFGLEQWYIPKLTKVGEISVNDLGKERVIKVSVTKVSLVKENMFLEVSDGTGVLDLVLFRAKEKVKKGDFLEVEGRVQQYKGKLELIVSTMKSLERGD